MRDVALPTRYAPADIEARWYAQWRERGYFHPEGGPGPEPYTIVIPPPNVTGVLHMGHALNNTIQDVLIRHRRMTGRRALYLPGTDHAGIATQNVVERELAEEGKTRDDLGREAFVERVWAWKEKYGSEIYDQLMKLGVSCDWERERFTMDPGLSRAVREVFVRLYDDDLVYRGDYIINWCPRCRTALSDEEAEKHDQAGHLWHIRYPLKDGDAGNGDAGNGDAGNGDAGNGDAGNGDAGNDDAGNDDSGAYLTVATTRPETMLGDTAIAVHPDDERYAARVGKTVVLPIVGREIPVVADDFVDPEFGTGAVKVTPAHDPNDFEIGNRHGLERVVVIGDDATMTERAGEFAGLDRYDARKRIVERLESEGFLVKVEEHRHAVGRCYRCDTVVEPYLSDQWFVRMKPLAAPALRVWKEGDLRFTPARWGKVYEHWLENVRDWCISRQIWWGHRIPVWTCANGHEFAAREDPTECPECGSEALEQDPDVLDTWFSSWLWPFSTLGWPDETEDLETFYPTDTLVTASEILFFWVARMVMAGYYTMGERPFSDVVINGTVRDARGRRMSKSLGNGIDPRDVIGEHGADALRYTLMAVAPTGTDLNLAPEDFRLGRNFANKIWNAARFVLMNLPEGFEPIEPAALGGHPDAGDMERWILHRCDETIRKVDAALHAFRLDDAAQAIYDFLWHDVCDWSIEWAKAHLDGPRGDLVRSVLVTVLERSLRLLHPIMPFLTEELWEQLPASLREAESIMIAPWPRPAGWSDPDAAATMALAKAVIGAARNLRAEYDVPPNRKAPLVVAVEDPGARAALERHAGDVARLAAASEAVIEAEPPRDEGAVSHVVRGGVEIAVRLSDLVDLDRERERLAGEIERAESLLASTRRRLGNDQFVSKAPDEVVRREREKEADLERSLERLEGLRDALPAG